MNVAETFSAGSSSPADTTPASTKPPRSGSGAPGERRVRTDIQALRAIAVGGVVIDHVFPGRLPGGYAGVDVFFVISGFLITTHLITKPPRNALDLCGFWARRIRRLLPAALTVLAVTLIATRLLAPETAWQETARAARSASLYFVNWQLAHDAVDYWAQGTATPVQHYWSLSVEEQFYVAWPILILLAFMLYGLIVRMRGARSSVQGRPNSLRPVLLVAFTAVLVVSLVASIQLTDENKANAYFVTWTRAWEFAVGALIAAFIVTRSTAGTRARELPGLRVHAGPVVAWAGLAAIAATFFLYDENTQFPGYLALLPVIGTALVIAAHQTERGSEPGTIMAMGPVQWVGNVSYSLYLWHWPVLLLLPYVTDRLHSDGHAGAGRLDKLAAIAVSLVLAELTRRLIEDPVRTFRPTLKLRWVYGAAVAAMAIVVVASGLQISEVRHRQQDAEKRFLAALNKPCVGAAAVLDANASCPPSDYDDLVFSPAEAKLDAPWNVAHAEKDCDANPPLFEDANCEYGDLDSDITVALVGNSHGLQWFPAVNSLAIAKGWHLVSALASGCVMGMPELRTDPVEVQSCGDWGKRNADRLTKLHPDLIIISNSQWAPWSTTPTETLEGDARKILDRWSKAGIPTVVIRDTLWSPENVPDCIVEHQDDFDACASPLVPDHYAKVAGSFGAPNVKTIDFSSGLCPEDSCKAVIGNMIVYFDTNHYTAAFSTTMAPYLNDALVANGLMP